MNKKIFIEEFTTKFSELFIDSFCIKYINDYGNKDIKNNILKARKILNKKINKKIIKKNLNNL